MDILFLTFLYPNKYNNLLGIFIKEHAKAIKNAGFSLTVCAICMVKGRSIYRRFEEHFVDENNIPTNILYIQSFFYKFFFINPVFIYWITRRFIEKYGLTSVKPDIIHSNMLYPSGIIGYFLSIKNGIDRVITEHWSKIDSFLKKNCFRKIGKKAFDQAKYITVVSSFLQKQLVNHKIDATKIIIIPNVVGSEIKFEEKKRSTEKIIFTSIAAWVSPKRPDLMISALEIISNKVNEKIVYNIVGEGHLLEGLNIRNASFPFDITLSGVLDKKEIAKILIETDYFLHASNTETFSVVIAEALMSGTPVIASKVGAIPELINEENGVLCDNNVNKWAEAILKAIGQKFDHKGIADKTKNKYSQEIISKNFTTLYERLKKKT
jgi:glycosyltransferase involved in cell wall biosynthesis